MSRSVLTRERQRQAAGLAEFGNAGEAALPAKALRDQVAETLTDKAASRAAVARAAGASAGLLSQFLNATHTHDDEGIRRKLTAWPRARELKAALPEAAFVETTISRQIHWVCSRAMMSGAMGLVVGPSGIGKDMAVYEYARQVGGGRVVIVECDGASTGRHGILREMAKAMDLPYLTDRRGDYTRQDVRDAIIERLKGSRAAGGAGMPLIVNEAHLLDYHAIEMVRRVLDKSGTGGVLVGTARLTTQLSGKGKLMYEQLRRRRLAVRAFRQVDEVVIGDVRAVAENIAGGRLGKGVIDVLHAEANSQEPGRLGKLGRVAALVHQAMEFADGGPIDAGDVDNAITLLAA